MNNMNNMNSQHPTMAQRAKGVSKRAIVSYILDYVVIVVLFILFALIDRAEPFHQPFSLGNISLQYPMANPERVSTGLLVIVSIIIPGILIIFFALIVDPIISRMEYKRNGAGTGNYGFMDRLWELNCGILGLLLAEGAAFVITQALKNLIGKPRPDLIARCQPGAGAADAIPYGLTTSDVCTQTDHAILKDGFRSFPSGHSSTAFAGLYYLSLYLAGKLHVLDHRGEVWRALLVLIPTLAAALIAGTRIIDARHHGFDVIVGSLIGLFVAWGAYRQYFYPVTESDKRGRAFPARTWGRDPAPSGATGSGRDAGMEPVRRRNDGYRADEENNMPGANSYTNHNSAAVGYGHPTTTANASSVSQRPGSNGHPARDPFASDSDKSLRGSYEMYPVPGQPGLTGHQGMKPTAGIGNNSNNGVMGGQTHHQPINDGYAGSTHSGVVAPQYNEGLNQSAGQHIPRRPI